MQKWMKEDWEFVVTVTKGKARDCRLGLEKGDAFVFQYGCPGGFCPRTMTELYTWCEVVRCGGDFTYRGCTSKYEMMFACPCSVLEFSLVAVPINRNENGEYIGISERPKV